MKAHSYARNMNLNRKYGNKLVEIQNFDFFFFFFFENKTEIFFLSQMFDSLLVYIAGIMV